MSTYNKAWYSNYAGYLKDPAVRRVHDFMFRSFVGEAKLRAHKTRLTFVDLGCGTCEFGHHVRPAHNYYGIDLDPTNQSTWKGDYTALVFDELYCVCDCFVSMFSTEIHLDNTKKYNLYERMFRAFPRMTCGLVSGFYYKDAVSDEEYVERDGFRVYQTIEAIPESNFDEIRAVAAVPPGFFVDEFVTVWKFLFRRQ